LTQKYNPIKFYSGDILFPSYYNISNFQKLLNSIKFHAGIFGLNDVRSNALNLLEENVEKTNSIWLMSNLFQVKKQYLAITKCSIMMIIENKNVKIGIIGLMHSNDLNQNQIKYVDYLHEANRLSDELVKRGVNIIIALTQMSWLHDEYLANNATKIDLIFGCGDDSEYGIRQVNNRWIVKSGVNYKNLSLIKIEFNEQLNKIMDLSIVKINVKENKIA
jgi:5'-nucleotidase